MADPQIETTNTMPQNRIDIFLDDAVEPVLSTTPPLSFELDTSRLDDGPHVMRIEAYDSQGVKGVRTIDFTVRNGPGIAVTGLRQSDVLDGKIPIVVNAYGGTSAVHWEPSQAETPAPPPTWAWVMLILVAAFGLFYGVEQWRPPKDFASTPTYGTFTGSPGPMGAAAAAARSEAAWPGAARCRRRMPVRSSIHDGSRPSERDSSSLGTHRSGRQEPVPRIAHPAPSLMTMPASPSHHWRLSDPSHK